MKNRLDILFPIARLVMGNIYEPRTTDAEGNPLIIKTGARAGEPGVKYHIAIAIAKKGEQHWATTDWGQQIWNFTHLLFPNGAASSPRFAWKIVDGDSTEPNSKGRKPVDSEGHAGHWILHFNGALAPRIFRNNGAQIWEEANAINLGDYVQVYGNISSNNSLQQPGIYLNYNLINFSGYGERITRGIDPTSVGFGGELPPGASIIPVNSEAPLNVPAPISAPIYDAVPPPMPLLSISHVATPISPDITTHPQQPIVPYPQILTPPVTTVVPPPPIVSSAPIPVPRIMLPAAGAISYEQYRAAGWSDEALIQSGKMQA